jgi:hypothetical protein
MMKKVLLSTILCAISVLLFGQNIQFSSQEQIWLARVNFSSLGEFEFFTTAQQKDSALVLQTLPDRDKFLFGKVPSALMRKIKKHKYPASLAAFEFQRDNGKLFSILGTLDIKTSQTSETEIVGGLYADSDSIKFGDFTCTNITNTSNNYFPLNRYDAVCDSIISVTESKIYKPQLTNTPKWGSFCKNMQEKSPFIYDDLELLILFFMQARNIGFSHFMISKSTINLERTIEEPQIQATELNDSVVVLKFETLSGRIAEIDSIFEKYKSFNIKIIDLRNTPGGKFESTYQIASHLLCKPIEAGAFVARERYSNNISKELMTQFYTLKEDEISKFSEILFEKKAINTTLYPKSNCDSSKQRLYVLTNNKTASACEPLVYGLKNIPNTIVVGEHTAGSILSPTIFDIGNHFFVIVPTSDYITADGKSLDGVGITPTIKQKSDNALNYVIKQINK